MNDTLQVWFESKPKDVQARLVHDVLYDIATHEERYSRPVIRKTESDLPYVLAAIGVVLALPALVFWALR